MAIRSNLIVLLSIQLLIVVSAKKQFDFFYFVVTWPGSFCHDKPCCFPRGKKAASNFRIHGLWPVTNFGRSVEDCDTHDTSLAPMEPLKPTMRVQWPGLACPYNETHFWEHEWLKHGTCSKEVLDQHSYFKAGLALKARLNPLKALANAGIKPNNVRYNLDLITTALKQVAGHEVFVQCTSADAGKKKLLHQLFYCVAHNGSTLIDCPRPPRSRCTAGLINFPSV